MKTIRVSCAIIFFGDKILAVQRSETMKNPLKWEFAGGKVEPGESEIDCIKREILEELNIEINVIDELSAVNHQYPTINIELIPFIAEYQSGELKLNEHIEYVLGNKEELINLDWAEADLPILKELLSR